MKHYYHTCQQQLTARCGATVDVRTRYYVTWFSSSSHNQRIWKAEGKNNISRLEPCINCEWPTHISSIYEKLMAIDSVTKSVTAQWTDLHTLFWDERKFSISAFHILWSQHSLVKQLLIEELHNHISHKDGDCGISIVCCTCYDHIQWSILNQLQDS